MAIDLEMAKAESCPRCGGHGRVPRSHYPKPSQHEIMPLRSGPVITAMPCPRCQHIDVLEPTKAHAAEVPDA